METINKSSWPPTYNLRISKKALHVHLKIIPHQGLEVVVPIRHQRRIKIADLLAEKKSWIEKHLSKVTVPELKTISSVNLQAINQIWQIKYQPLASKQIRALACPSDTGVLHTLILSGDVLNIAHVQSYLKKWLIKQAELHLIPWLHALSIKHDLAYNKASVRAQRTMWGSCTSSKNISLNYKLLFIPAPYAEHVMLHELCHTKYLNHSKRFWNLLAKIDPNCEINDCGVREADQYISPFFI